MTTGTVLLTGATGFLGRALLARVLQQTDARVIAPVRAAGEDEAARRVEDALASALGSAEAVRSHVGRVTALPGDLQAPGLGLPAGRREEIVATAETVVHCAASVSFVLGLDRARAINVGGTAAMLDLAGEIARRDRLRRFVHVSTAFVAGDHAGVYAEDDLDVGQGFRNTYEQTKLEAERLVRARQDELPLCVVRPSIVVGDRHTGWTSSFNVLYWPLRAFARGLYTTVPADPAAPVDVVSVDYVADAILHLATAPDATGTFHVVAGENASTVGELVDLAAKRFSRPRPDLVSPASESALARLLARLPARERAMLRRSGPYLPYLAVRARYDDRRARSQLAQRGIVASPLREYFDRLMDFALATRWGRGQAVAAGPGAASP